MRENSRTITEWADETFGFAASGTRIAIRANTEMAELLAKVSAPVSGLKDSDMIRQFNEEVVFECADVCIVLARLCQKRGYDLFEMIDRKMEINRKREWVRDGSGQGQHVK